MLQFQAIFMSKDKVSAKSIAKNNLESRKMFSMKSQDKGRRLSLTWKRKFSIEKCRRRAEPKLSVQAAYPHGPMWTSALFCRSTYVHNDPHWSTLTRRNLQRTAYPHGPTLTHIDPQFFAIIDFGFRNSNVLFFGNFTDFC